MGVSGWQGLAMWLKLSLCSWQLVGQLIGFGMLHISTLKGPEATFDIQVVQLKQWETHYCSLNAVFYVMNFSKKGHCPGRESNSKFRHVWVFFFIQFETKTPDFLYSWMPYFGIHVHCLVGWLLYSILSKIKGSIVSPLPNGKQAKKKKDQKTEDTVRGRSWGHN